MALTGDAAVGHLLRRAGFGLAPDDAAEWRKLGYKGAVRRLLDELDEPLPPDPPSFDPYEPGAIQQVWLDRMASGKAPLGEKLAFLWHGHFATSDAKVQEPALLWFQYRLFRADGAGRFGPLVLKVSRDVAMIRWLDGNANRKGQANENYARELQELFTLGIGHYTEGDIREIARAFTGWGSRHHDFVFADQFHDHGEKTVHGKTGDLDGTDVVVILTSLPACRAFVASKLLRFFSHPDPAPEDVAQIAEVLDATDGDLRAALFVMFLSPGFLDERHARSLVKSPVEMLVHGMRTVGIKETPLWVHGSLERMGQILFRPPSVKGWPEGTAWLTSAAVVERMKAARRFAQGNPEAAEWIMDLALDGQAPPPLADALMAAAGEERVALALASPEFQLA